MTQCNPIYPNLLKLANSTWITYGKRIESARVEPTPFFHDTRREMRPHGFVGLKENGFFTMDDLWRSSIARALKHSRTTVIGREVYLGARGEYGHAEYFHLNLPSRQLGFS